MGGALKAVPIPLLSVSLAFFDMLPQSNESVIRIVLARDVRRHCLPSHVSLQYLGDQRRGGGERRGEGRYDKFL